jgi:oligopeptide/dipeptide ABC transporter ATP-binding protein
MYAGYIVEDAPVEALYEHPAHPYTWSLLRSLPGVQGRSKGHGERLEAIRGMPPDLVRLPSVPGCPFAPRCKFAKEPCLRHNPPLREIAGEHKAACWVDLQTGELR